MTSEGKVQRKGPSEVSKLDDIQVADYEELLSYPPEQEGRIRRKIDLYLLPVLAGLYLMSYLDRSNMGNAAIIGLKEDLHLSSTQYNLCNSIFFIPYAVFEIPSNLILKVMRPSKYICLTVVAWGTLSTLQGIVQGFSSLMAARFFLATCEAGFFPAASYLLTMWYHRHEIRLRAGIFYSAGALSGAVSGLIAYLINLMDGVAGLSGGRWLFILEGISTVVLGIAAPFLLPDSPESAGSFNEHQAFNWKYVWSALRDYKVWLIVVVYWGSAIPIYGFIYALLRVVGGIGLVGLISIPKDGYAPGALYFMLFLVAMGLYCIVCGTVAWTAGMALMISVGNLGGVAETNINLTKEAPYYWTGYGTSLGVIVLSFSIRRLRLWRRFTDDIPGGIIGYGR
ncbi:major facilitator superfamily domain-containing protein [Aspergillus oleicola]